MLIPAFLFLTSSFMSHLLDSLACNRACHIRTSSLFLFFFLSATLPALAIDRDTSNQELFVPLRDKLSASYTISLQKSKFALTQFLQYVYLYIAFFTVKYTSSKVSHTHTHTRTHTPAHTNTYTHIHTYTHALRLYKAVVDARDAFLSCTAIAIFLFFFSARMHACTRSLISKLLTLDKSATSP